MAGPASFSRALAVAAAALALVGPAQAAPQQTRPGAPAKPARPAPAPAPRPDTAAERLARTSADLLKAMRDYRASLDRLLAIYESDLARNTELVEERFAAFAKGQATRLEIEDAETARVTAEENVAETRRWIEEADRLQLDASLGEYIARLPALSPGGYQSTDVFVRYVGTAPFGLIDAPKIQRFFAERFGRALPISAWGQTAAHDRFGFDHRNAMDVAVHPDRAEGQILADYLRRSGISFAAFRQAVPGAATGAHFHIGEPSRRLTVPVRR